MVSSVEHPHANYSYGICPVKRSSFSVLSVCAPSQYAKSVNQRELEEKKRRRKEEDKPKHSMQSGGPITSSTICVVVKTLGGGGWTIAIAPVVNHSVIDIVAISVVFGVCLFVWSNPKSSKLS